MADNYKSGQNYPAQNNNSSPGIMPPQAVEIEESILGGMLIENDAA